jgi:chromosome segregation protein
VHLTSIKLRGFKSFPDPTEVRLERGVAVVVGPNGSGKSNIADALVWASGSQAASELRAERGDDVLFAGSDDRPAADSCEVELLFDNSDGALAALEYDELSIARRLHRGGEGQYLVNGATVRRLDVVELLADVGLGPGMGSVIGQGRVEAVLASRPEERRALVEEAAGLGRFKRRRHRAELKLARVAAQTERARDLEAEVAKRLRPLALQATAAERAEKLAAEIAGLRAALAALDLAELDERLEEAQGRQAAVRLERARIDRALDDVLARRGSAEEELADAAGRRESATAALYRLRSAGERLELRREAASSLAERLRAGAVAGVAVTHSPSAEEEVLAEQLGLVSERIAALERALAEREGLPPAARALAEQGEELALSGATAEPGDERAVAAALGWRAAALVTDTPAQGLALLERARAAGLGNLAVLIGKRARDLVEQMQVVPRNQLLAATERSVTREGFGYDPQTSELWFSGEAAEAVMLELEARRRELVAEAERLAVSAEDAAAASGERAQAAREAQKAQLAPLVRAAERLAQILVSAGEASARFEAPLRGRVDAGSARAGELAGVLRSLGADEANIRRETSDAGERAAAIDVELARFEAEAKEAQRRLEEAGVPPAEGDDRAGLAERLERLERRRQTLGGVNPFAKEEYEREKERLTELRVQREDLERSLAELEGLRAELTETVERRFTETFTSVRDNFHEVAQTLFPGGEGRLRLTEPEEEGATPGVEVELRPAGKRVTKLSLLSGGERALGAIAFLFSLFLARPCPFYLLDEVEAALDDTNIGRFVELLGRFSERAQFIVVTHQKRTMEAADTLYGVTMGGDGVSQVVSRRLPRESVLATA